MEPFLDDIGVKGSRDKDETEVAPGVQRFVRKHLEWVRMVLEDLEWAQLMLSAEKSYFAQKEGVIVGRLCNSEGQLPEGRKVEAIQCWGLCKMLSEVRGFLGACLFF